MMFFKKIFPLCVCLTFGLLKAQSTIYVNYAASGTNNGGSWSNAFTSLQDALSLASNGDEIWVAKGTYVPSLDTMGIARIRAEFSTFRLKQGVHIYGGFLGNETQKSQRNWIKNETILSGEMGDPLNDSDNVAHVVSLYGDFTTYAKLDGFVLEKGFGRQASPFPFGNDTYWKNGCLIHCSGGAKAIFQNLILRVSTIGFSLIYLEGDRSSTSAGLNDYYLVNLKVEKGMTVYPYGWVINCETANMKMINSLIYTHLPGALNSAISSNYQNGGSYWELYNNTLVGDTAWRNMERALVLQNVDSAKHFNNLCTGKVTYPSSHMGRNNQYFHSSPFNWDTVNVSAYGYASMPYDVYDTLDFRPRPETYGRDRGDTIWLPIDVLDLDEDGDTTERIDFDIDMNPRVSGSQVDIGAYEYFEGFVDTNAQEICVGDSLFWQGSWRRGDTVFDVSFSKGSLGDSVLRLQLQHDSINLSISPSPWGDYFTSNEADSGSTYQWIDCFFKDTIPGATSRTFHPSQNGQYQVIITNSLGCVDTSECVNLPNIGLSESKQEFKAYPNPTENEVEIWAPGLVQNKPFPFTLYSTGGQLIQKGAIQAPHNLKLNLSHLERGLYLLYIEGAEPIRIILQ
ncbi:T9SS type A sorting domain-containing protein [Croceimicrobium hydrocarbonivorans]|uniref:T9SS type A sorting domain-containing protein n=1 Tax=Croceimicrobium hydrocarbonivorans TaxID=2761580 RepID=A0A7H0VBW5_9FLAO|nr:T9SS type A sorting domain-containing protein [Croceimicrobium hydrocarbonivorans]QNR23213.1 T9SS type A sorting domain-containing protein [Croceimicrobium hydrocarbonivorans]